MMLYKWYIKYLISTWLSQKQFTASNFIIKNAKGKENRIKKCFTPAPSIEREIVIFSKIEWTKFSHKTSFNLVLGFIATMFNILSQLFEFPNILGVLNK